MTKKTQRERHGVGPSRLSRLAGLVAILAGSLVAAAWLPNAAAQTRAKPKAKPKTSASAVAPAGSGVPATGPVPAPHVDPGLDGGVRTSPLNPAPEEMPGAAPGGSAAAGAPLPAIDYDKLLGDIAALRARVADVGDALFVSRIVLALETDGDHAKVGHLTVELDDGIVYTAPPGLHAPDAIPVYEHAVAPGHHAVTVEVDRKDDRDDTFRDAQRTRFIVDVPKDQRLAVTLRIGDDSDMGGSFPADHHGKYDLRVRMKAAATPVKR